MTGINLKPNDLQKAKLRVSDFWQLNDSGAFAGYRKTELIDGEIYYLNAQYRRHLIAKMDLLFALRDCLKSIESGFTVVSEGSVEIPDFSAPEPDIILTSEPYGEGAIPVSTVGLIVEISDTTLKFDLEKKASIYATAMVPEYWVVDVDGKRLVQLSAPKNGAYTATQEAQLGQTITSVTVDGLKVDLTK
jgi:Uma2 family endonuclease